MDMPRPAITYLPPDDADVDRLVREASQRLAAGSGDPSYLDPEVMWELAAFIKLIGKLKAKQLNANEAQCFDSRSKPDYP